MHISNNEHIKYRVFKISIGFIFYNLYFDTKAFKIENRSIQIVLAIWYTLISLLFGWWGGFKSWRNTIKAIHINLSGGSDCSKEMNELMYDEKTNYVWNNLLRKTKEKISKTELEMIIDIQDIYEESKKEKYSEENIDFIIINLGLIDIHRINRSELSDIIDALKLYDAKI